MKPRHYIVWTIGMTLMIVSTCIAMGYFMNDPSYYTWPRQSPAGALPTALMFFAVGVALVFLAWPPDIERRSGYIDLLEQIKTHRMTEMEMLRGDLLGSKTERLHRPQVKVLLVEDDPNDRILIMRMIGALFNVDFAGSLKEAIDMTRKSTYSCAVIDLGLKDTKPGATVQEFAAKAADVPCVAMSGMEDFSAAALEQGATAFVRKDKLNTEYLSGAIQNAILRKLANKDRN